MSSDGDNYLTDDDEPSESSGFISDAMQDSEPSSCRENVAPPLPATANKGTHGESVRLSVASMPEQAAKTNQSPD